jgi:protein arginine kinase
MNELQTFEIKLKPLWIIQMEIRKFLPDSFHVSFPWSHVKDSIWPASVIMIHRNLSPFSFPSKMTEGERVQTLDLVQHNLRPHLKNPHLLTANDLSPHEKEFVFEHFSLHEGSEKFDPGHALIVDDSGEFIALTNVEDHLQLYSQSSNTPLHEHYESLAKIERSLNKELHFAFSDRFGYLTSDPTICGTGLIVQSFLHLPASIQLDYFSDLTSTFSDDVYFHGLSKEDTYLADIVLVENRYKLGTTEEDIVKTVERISQKLVEEEKKLRAALPPEEEIILKDKVCRAFGLLAHSYQLQIQEALSALSLIHLAKELGWVTNAEDFSFADLFFQIKRAHLLQNLKVGDLSKEEIQHKRAELIHQKLKNATLTIS